MSSPSLSSPVHRCPRGTAASESVAAAVYQGIVELGRDGMVLLDHALDIEFHNRQARELFLADRDPGAVGRSLAEWVHPGDRAALVGALRRLRARGPGATATIEVRAPDVTVGRHEAGHESGPGRVVEASIVVLHDAPATGDLLVSCRDVTERHATRTELRHRAAHDELTGVYNRRTFLELADQALSRGIRRGTQVGVIYVDVDAFKAVNDRFGHRVGDEVLIGVAHKLTRAVRDGDAVARIGGDEFLALCEPVEDIHELAVVAGRCAEALTGLVHAAGHPDPFPCSSSIGFAVSQPFDEVADLVDRADQRLLASKRTRRPPTVR